MLEDAHPRRCWNLSASVQSPTHPAVSGKSFLKPAGSSYLRFSASPFSSRSELLYDGGQAINTVLSGGIITTRSNSSIHLPHRTRWLYRRSSQMRVGFMQYHWTICVLGGSSGCCLPEQGYLQLLSVMVMLVIICTQVTYHLWLSSWDYPGTAYRNWCLHGKISDGPSSNWLNRSSPGMSNRKKCPVKYRLAIGFQPEDRPQIGRSAWASVRRRTATTEIIGELKSVDGLHRYHTEGRHRNRRSVHLWQQRRPFCSSIAGLGPVPPCPGFPAGQSGDWRNNVRCI